MELRDRFRGALLGLAAGDAVGTSVKFEQRGHFAPVTDMTGGGPFALAAAIPAHWRALLSLGPEITLIADRLFARNGAGSLGATRL